MMAQAAGLAAPMAVARRHEEHHPRDQRHAPADRLDRGSDDEVDGAVVLGDGEEVGDPDQGEDEVTADATEDLLLAEAERVDPDGQAAT